MSNSWTTGAVDALRQQHNLPFAQMDEQGQAVKFNDRFRLIYGWDDGLVGQTIGMILPASFREPHHAGFSRFKLTETSKLVNHPLELATICSDGAEFLSEHFIVA